MRSRIHFIGTTSDLIALMSTVEAQKPLKYTLFGFFDEPFLKQANSFSNIDGFGISKFGNLVRDDCFYLSEPGLEMELEPVPQNKGGVKYLIRSNPKTLRFSPGGLHESNSIIAGELMKYSDEPEAKEMFKIFQREIKRQFKRNKLSLFWMGKEAAAMHLAGARLTDDVNSLLTVSIEMNPASPPPA